MTRAEWDALDLPARANLVATKVMGYEDRATYYESDGDYAGQLLYDGDKCMGAAGEGYNPFTPDGMMAVVEKMKDERRQVGIHWENGESAAWWGTFWECEISKPYDYKTAYRATHATSAPEAVCLAALMALGHMEGK